MMWSQQTLYWSSIAKRIVKSSKKATEAEGYEWIVPRPRKMMDESLSRNYHTSCTCSRISRKSGIISKLRH